MNLLIRDLRKSSKTDKLKLMQTLSVILSSNDSFKIEFYKQGGIHMVLKNLQEDDWEIAGTAFHILESCFCQKLENKLLLTTQETFRLILEVLKEKSMNHKKSSLCLIASIVAGNVLGQALTREIGFLHHLMELFYDALESLSLMAIRRAYTFHRKRTAKDLYLKWKNSIRTPTNLLIASAIIVMADEEGDQDRRCEILDVVQSMIDISADRLEGLRTQCATSAELTQQEIRTLEGKLIKLFSRQLVTKAKLQEDGLSSERKHVPSLQQWLQGVCQKVGTLEALQEKSEHDLRNILSEQILLRDEVPNETSELTLYWDSWDRHQVIKGSTSPRPSRGTRQERCSVPSEDSLPYNNNNYNNCNNLCGSISTLATASSTSSITSLPQSSTPTHQGHAPLSPPVHHLEHVPRRGRLPTEPGPYCTDYGYTSPLLSSPVKSPPYNSVGLDGADDGSTLQVPKSPRTPTITRPMCHAINHRFTKTFKMIATCDFCDKQMFIGTGLKCKECKYKCHRDCESKVPPSCGLPRELVDEFRKTLQNEVFVPSQSPSLSRSSPSHHTPNLLSNIGRTRKRQYTQPSINIPPFPGPDSSSNTSSCNSSTPSSPALVLATHTPLSQSKQQFHFPETHPLMAPPALEEMVETYKSNDSDRTVSVSGSGSTDSERTPVRVDSQDSQVSEGETVDRSWPRQNRDGLSIPPGWLCYLAPEIIRSLRVRQKHDEEELPFTKDSDVYAFGTVWYELLCGEWPFKAQPPEAIIWQVGKGMKQSLANLQASRDVKDILMLCWSYRQGERPDFARLLKTLEKLPKKRLARSPSHPIHLSRSAESVF
ncbi:hypothetical protein C0J52_03779 [Blattella germanica]|nr:hypothetical protein C0J52_03779 [Blattella germanica]